jgi:hypothetical protein
MDTVDRLPPLLTVEEAAKVLRIGRTKAYALAQEWRATSGRSGLPVVDFGHVLRVPLCQLEQLIGGQLTAPAMESAPAIQPAAKNTHARQPTKRPRNPDTAQLGLIEPAIND